MKQAYHTLTIMPIMMCLSLTTHSLRCFAIYELLHQNIHMAYCTKFHIYEAKFHGQDHFRLESAPIYILTLLKPVYVKWTKLAINFFLPLNIYVDEFQ